MFFSVFSTAEAIRSVAPPAPACVVGDPELPGAIRACGSFALEIRTGDRFSVVYAEEWVDGVKLSDGPVLAAEFVNRFDRERPGLAAIALTTDGSILTSVPNDAAFAAHEDPRADDIGGEEGQSDRHAQGHQDHDRADQQGKGLEPLHYS